MKPTNYHLFDFFDFDTELSRNESLWKAYKPTAVYEKEGDIYVTVPSSSTNNIDNQVFILFTPQNAP